MNRDSGAGAASKGPEDPTAILFLFEGAIFWEIKIFPAFNCECRTRGGCSGHLEE